MNVAVRDLKNKLSHYLRRVRAGGRIVVTDRGRPIAEIGPIRAKRLTPAERLLRMAERGEVTLPRTGKPLPAFEPLPVRGRPVSETLLEDRD